MTLWERYWPQKLQRNDSIFILFHQLKQWSESERLVYTTKHLKLFFKGTILISKFSIFKPFSPSSTHLKTRYNYEDINKYFGQKTKCHHTA